MNNIRSHNDVTAFHPGYYVAEIVEDMGITQDEFAARLGTTGKTLSQLINGQCNLSMDLAKKLSAMLGTSPDLWLNLQTAYEQKLIEMERERELPAQLAVLEMTDYGYFEKAADLPHTKLPGEKVANLCRLLSISSLERLRQPDLIANFRTGINAAEEKNIVNAQAWLLFALECAKGISTLPYNAEAFKAALPEIRSMTVQDPIVFLPRLKGLLAGCGVAFVLLPHLKNSGVNGVVKWVSPDRAVLAVNDRRTYSDTFWFSLFHELRHIMQHKTKTVFMSMDSEMQQRINEKLEDDADSFAQDYLIPPREYAAFAPSAYTTDEQICAFAERIGIHPGIVAGRMQHDTILPHYRCASLKQKFKVAIRS